MLLGLNDDDDDAVKKPDGSPRGKSRSLSRSRAQAHFSLPRRGIDDSQSRFTQTRRRLGVSQSPGREGIERRRCSDDDLDVADVEKKSMDFFFSTSSSVPSLWSFLRALLSFTLRSVVTVVANSCPPTQSVTMEEADRGLSGGSIFLTSTSTERKTDGGASFLRCDPFFLGQAFAF